MKTSEFIYENRCIIIINSNNYENMKELSYCAIEADTEEVL